MNDPQLLQRVTSDIQAMSGMVVERVFNLYPPDSTASAEFIAKVLSKLTPLVANHIEVQISDVLNRSGQYTSLGEWRRQDPGYPDVVLDTGDGTIAGIEVKAWYPFATEITGRFKASQSLCRRACSLLCLVAWMPTKLLYGEPTIIGSVVVSARSVAEARDNHYHNPPTYVVAEPNNTEDRTRNLQQLNTEGFRWQGSTEQHNQAVGVVKSWGTDGTRYQLDDSYQQQITQLRSQFPYRTDTNFAKIDRINHPEIERFKTSVLNRMVFEKSVGEWARILSGRARNSDGSSSLNRAMRECLGLEVGSSSSHLFDLDE